MTISTNPTRNEYTATAAQTIFNYTFKIFASGDLLVYQTPAGQSPDDSTDLITSYTVDPGTIGDEAGGFITLDTGTASGDLITIVSNIAESRTTDYQNSGDFLPDTVNNDFDRTVSLAKQSADKVSRTLRVANSLQDATDLTIPNPESGNFLRWKADLSGLENITLDLGNPGSSAAAISYDDTAAAFEWGVTDVQAALDLIKSGVHLDVPSTNWLKFSTDGGATINGGIIDVGALSINYDDSKISFSDNRILIQADTTGDIGQIDIGYTSPTGPALTSGNNLNTFFVDNDGYHAFGIPKGSVRPGGLVNGDLWLDISVSGTDPFLRVVNDVP